MFLDYNATRSDVLLLLTAYFQSKAGKAALVENDRMWFIDYTFCLHGAALGLVRLKATRVVIVLPSMPVLLVSARQ